MCIRFPLLLLLLLSGFLVRAQVKFIGKVVDGKSKQPLISASMEEVGNRGNKILSDSLGRFALNTKNQYPAVYVTYVGYRTTIQLLYKTNANIIELLPDQNTLNDLTIVSGSQSAKFTRLAQIDLKLGPVRNTQELLRLVPGLFIAQHAGGGKAEQIFLRGFDCDHGTDVQILVDGMPVNMVSHAHGQGYADTHFVIPETIHRLNYGFGPYYADHGNFNTAGYVQFSTFDKIEKSLVQIERGLFNTLRSLAMVDLLKKRKDKESAYIASDFYYTDGPYEHKQNFKRFNVFGKYNRSLSERTQFIGSLSYFKSEWDASGQIPSRAVSEGLIDRFGTMDPTEGGNTSRFNLNFSINHRFNEEATWENQCYYSYYLFNLYSNFTFYLKDIANGDEINQAESRNLFGYQTKFTNKKSLGQMDLTASGGLGFRWDHTDRSRLAHVVKREFLNDITLGKISEGNGFAWWNEEIHAGKWLLDAGIRFDYLHFDYLDKSTQQKPEQNKSILSPKLNIEYTLNQRLQFFVKAGKGFHSNDTRVVVANQGYQILPAAWGADLGLIAKPSSHLWLNATAWSLYLKQEFKYAGDDGVVEPGGKSLRAGIDLIVRYQFTGKLFAQFNINFAHARELDQPKGKNYIPLAPELTSRGGIYYKAKKGLQGGISYRYMMQRPANEDNSIVAKSYFIVDASINYEMARYEIGIAMENILNTAWNEAQFASTSRLQNEYRPFTDLNFTPGTPFFLRLKLARYF